jgi:hypothetical protein
VDAGASSTKRQMAFTPHPLDPTADAADSERRPVYARAYLMGVTPGASIASICSSLGLASPRLSNSRAPLPSISGTIETRI